MRLEGLEQVVQAGAPPAAAADDLRAHIAQLNPDRNAAVFFTGGTTGTPKAVPHTHAALLWFAARSGEVMAAAVVSEHMSNGTICFAPYFHVMGFVANFVFNLHCACRSVIADTEVTLSAPIMLQACTELKPAVLNTVPWVRALMRACKRTRCGHECSQSGGSSERRRARVHTCLLYTSPSPRDGLLSRMPSSA